MRLRTPVLAAGLIGGGAVALSTGAVTVDLGWGRSLRPLGPLSLDIAASRGRVFEVIGEPYLGRATRAMAEKLEVLERADNLALAAHFTPLGSRLRATTVEAVRFVPPGRVEFRLLRGPVPHVREAFDLEETADGTRLSYSGEIGADLWAAGRWWASVVARKWVSTVESSMEAIRSEAERAGRAR